MNGFITHNDYSNNESIEKAIEENISVNKKRILIVDDETLVRKTIVRHFQKFDHDNCVNFDLHEAENAITALNCIYDNYQNNIRFDMIILDEYMPFMRGSTLLKVLNDIYSDGELNKIKIISHTAFDTKEIKELILKNGAYAIWNKPIHYEEFKTFMKNIEA